jgi:hypothetical protein
MANLRIYLEGEKIGPQLRARAEQSQQRMRRALAETAKDISQLVLERGRADIASAGKFGSRWTQGLRADVFYGITGGDVGSVSVEVSHTDPLFQVFERGAFIKGAPLLWLPLSSASVPEGVWARDYPGRLFRVNRTSGPPILMDAADKQAKYVGLDSVTIPKKFHIVEIIRTAMQSASSFYKAHFRSG